jgi:AbrB family looped-hinge helix DNA binding protein
MVKMTMEEKIVENVSSNGRVIIPKKWRKLLGIEDETPVELELSEGKEIIVKRKVHPLEIEDDLFAGIEPFTEAELMEAKRTIIPIDKWSEEMEVDGVHGEGRR